MDNLNVMLEGLFYQFCTIAKWVFVFRIASDGIKKANTGDLSGVFQSLLHGTIGYGSLYLSVSILDSVQDAFKK